MSRLITFVLRVIHTKVSLFDGTCYNRSMSITYLIISIIWLIFFIWALLDITQAEKDTGWKLIWVLICLVFPVAGTIVYYFTARQKDMRLPQDFQK